MRLLGLDYGEKRIGMAISDETQTLAREIGVVQASRIFAELEVVLQDFEVEAVVLGLPLGMQGQTTQKTDEVKVFQKKLEKKAGLPVILSDERLSTVMARSVMGNREHVDGLAAQIMLQNYLDRKRNKVDTGNT